ncbi:MAG: histidinol-phosphate aminotransferase family protein [Proteobacteria bacterium]|nr:MAG: histidinol-phosphate aminotransferase family protein [Pseudomonadota bacterium]
MSGTRALTSILVSISIPTVRNSTHPSRWTSLQTIRIHFSEFQTAAIQVEAKLLEFESFESDDFRIDLEQLDQYLTQFKPKIFSLCNPNSPTGGYLGPEAISGLATRHPYTLILLDESFLSLSIHHQAQDAKYPANVVRIVSLTKDYAIAGIRLGYALGSPELLNKMKAEIPSWSVNALAQKIGITLFDDKNFLDRSRHSIFRDKVLVEASFRERSVRYIPGTTVFCMFKHPYKDLSQALLDDHKILIRSCDSYGLSQWYRIAIRPEIEMQRFFKALDSVNEGLEERR